MNTGQSRRTLSCDSHVGTRHRPIQKSIKDIPEWLITTWGERWPTIPRQRRVSDSTLEDRNIPAFQFEQGLSEFQLDPPPTPTSDERDPSSSTQANHPHRSKAGSVKTKAKRQRDERWAPYTLTPSLQAHSRSSSAGLKRARLAVSSYPSPTLLLPPQQTVVPSPIYDPSAIFDNRPLMPKTLLYYPQDYDSQHQLDFPTIGHDGCGASSSDPEHSDAQLQLLSSVSSGTTDATFAPFQGSYPPDSASWWATGYETNHSPSASVTPRYNNYDPVVNQYYMSSMDPSTFPIQSQPSDPFDPLAF